MDTIKKLYRKIKILNETIWENRVGKTNIDAWLSNFDEEEEKLHALFLLSQFIYFGADQMRNLLKALYRDLYKYRMIEKIRLQNGNTLDLRFIETEFEVIQSKTRFLGVGNPSESGAHLLYTFRQENKIPKTLFINSADLFIINPSGKKELKNPHIREYVFIDDFCGSGQQAENYSKELVEDIKALNKDINVSYFMLFTTKYGKDQVKKNTKFDIVDAVFEFDDSFKCFDLNSRYFKNIPTDISQISAQNMSDKHGKKLFASIIGLENKALNKTECELAANNHKHGYRDSQLLLGFNHNTPDNTLPIIWYDEEEIAWKPIFKRYNKKYNL